MFEISGPPFAETAQFLRFANAEIFSFINWERNVWGCRGYRGY
jgi:hypothetical protein